MRIANSFVASDSAMRPIMLSPSGFIQGQPSGEQQQSAEANGQNGPNQRERREIQRNSNFGNNNNNTPNFNNNNNTGFNKRKDEQPDAQYGNRQVTTVQHQEEQGAAGGSRKFKPAERPRGQPRPPYTFEDMMNQPCKMHSGVGKLASHTTRQCIWVERLAKGGAGNPPPPPPPPPGPPPANARQQFPRHDA